MCRSLLNKNRLEGYIHMKCMETRMDVFEEEIRKQEQQSRKRKDILTGDMEAS